MCHFSIQGDAKASLVKGFSCALKSGMYQHFTAGNTIKYMDVLLSLVERYFEDVHRCTAMVPWRRLHNNKNKTKAHGNDERRTCFRQGTVRTAEGRITWPRQNVRVHSNAAHEPRNNKDTSEGDPRVAKGPLNDKPGSNENRQTDRCARAVAVNRRCITHHQTIQLMTFPTEDP